MWVIALIPMSGSSFKTLPVIRSYPGASFGCNCFIADLTSVSFNFLTGVSSWPGVSRACKIVSGVETSGSVKCGEFF
jgi:hypothetical protein